MDYKLITAGAALVLGCGTPLVMGHLQAQAAQQAQQRQDVVSDEQRQYARELPTSPEDAVRGLVALIAVGTPNAVASACLMFSDTAAIELAAASEQPTCTAAITALHAQINDPAAYSNDLVVPEDSWAYTTATTATIDGCAVTWDSFGQPADPGPLPGQLSLTQIDGDGWQITAYRSCP